MYKHFFKRFFDFWIALVAFLSRILAGEEMSFLPCGYVTEILSN